MTDTQTSQKGAAHLIIVGVIILLAVVGFAGFRVLNSSSTNDRETSDTSTRPPATTNENVDELTLQNLGLNSWDNILVTNNAVREFSSNGFKGFYAFGDILGGGGPARQNPNFEYASLTDAARAVAAIDGMIVHINQQPESNDYEVFLQTKEKSIWMIGYDHLTDLQVTKGDTVKAGDVLGTPARQNNGQRRFEMQINNEQSGTIHHCPSALLGSDVKATELASLRTMLQKWESQTGLDLYDIDAQNPVGCLKTTLTAAEAEGR